MRDVSVVVVYVVLVLLDDVFGLILSHLLARSLHSLFSSLALVLGKLH